MRGEALLLITVLILIKVEKFWIKLLTDLSACISCEGKQETQLRFVSSVTIE